MGGRERDSTICSEYMSLCGLSASNNCSQLSRPTPSPPQSCDIFTEFYLTQLTVARSSAIVHGPPCNVLFTRNLATTKCPVWKKNLQSTNDFQVHPRSSQLLLDRLYISLPVSFLWPVVTTSLLYLALIQR